jgi:hypothetical protein
MKHFGHLWMLLLGTCIVASSVGCGDDVKNNTGGSGPGGDGSGGSGADGTGGAGAQGGGPPANPADKIDVLLMIDNSRSMADKQEILASAVPDLVGGLTNPACVDAAGNTIAQPPGPADACPAGSSRAFKPISDMHVGIISSSLGGHGADSCPASTACAGGTNTTSDDKGHLLARSDACAGGTLPTWADKGFLAWDPAQTRSPPGAADAAALAAGLQEMIIGVGQIGCGYEAQLESWLRFLVDPAPYETLTVIDAKATKQGVDQVLLQQRADFLRPDSTLLVLMLTDENDCSIIEGGQYYYAAQLKAGSSAFHLPRARQICATNPADPCCKSCGQTAGECPDDPTCGDETAVLSELEDAISLRCFEQKRRFGIDFLYPLQRYVNALTQPTLDIEQMDLAGTAQPNPIYSDLANSGAPVRSAGNVFLAGIVGVPWQLIAKDPSDLSQGYKPTAEIDWPAVLGDPQSYVPASDPHMVESIDPRPGLTTSGNADPIHGHEYTIADRDDLQYACTFPLPTPRDCTDPQLIAAGLCDCDEPNNDNPLCGGADNQTQLRAKAYPGLRHLSVIRAIGSQGVAGSICAENTHDPSLPTWGYRPAMASIIRAISPSLVK